MIKPGVDLLGLQPPMAIAYTICHGIYFTYGLPCVITSGVDGKHGPHTHHKKGLAFDLRTRDAAPELIVVIYEAIKHALGAQFQVVLEKDHIHVEFDPA